MLQKFSLEVIVYNSLNMKYSRKYLPPIPLKYEIIFFVNDNYSVIFKNRAKFFCWFNFPIIHGLKYIKIKVCLYKYCAQQECSN